MKTRKLISHFGAVVVGVLALSSGGSLWASQGHALRHDRGIIQSVTPLAETFTLKGRRDATLGLQWDSHTRFFEHGKPIISTDLKSGQRVSVAYEKHGDTWMAKKVRVLERHGNASQHSKTES